MTGSLAILNVAAGDTKLTFDSKDPAEREKAARIVKDMIRRGFVLLIEVGRDDKGPVYRRAQDFDETTNEYIVAGMSSDAEADHEEAEDQAEEATTPAPRARSPRGRPKAAKGRVPAASTNAVAVARTAGG